MTKTLLVVYHSMTGGTRQMAQAAARGAALETEVSVLLRTAPSAVPEDVLSADGYVFATPENLATMSGMMKDFFDRTYYPVLDRIAGRPYCIPSAPAATGRAPSARSSGSPPVGGSRRWSSR